MQSEKTEDNINMIYRQTQAGAAATNNSCETDDEMTAPVPEFKVGRRREPASGARATVIQVAAYGRFGRLAS